MISQGNGCDVLPRGKNPFTPTEIWANKAEREHVSEDTEERNRSPQFTSIFLLCCFLTRALASV